MSTVFTFFISTITLKSMCISIALILAGLLGILLVAMLCNDAVQPYNPDEKNTSPDTEYGIEALLDCNIWEWLLLICGGMIVGPILYLLPISLPSWSYFPLIVFFSLILYALVNRWLRRMHLKWAEEDKQKRRKRSKSHKKKKK